MPPRGSARRHLRNRASALPAAPGVDLGLVDLLLAHFLADLFLADDGFGTQPDSFDRDGLLGHDRAFGVQLDLVLGLGDVRAGRAASRLASVTSSRSSRTSSWLTGTVVPAHHRHRGLSCRLHRARHPLAATSASPVNPPVPDLRATDAERAMHVSADQPRELDAPAA